MRDGSHKAIMAALRDARRSKGRKKPSLPQLPKLDSAGVDITICGVSNTYGGSRGVLIDPQRLRSVWAEVLGKPDLQMDGACPHLPVDGLETVLTSGEGGEK